MSWVARTVFSRRSSGIVGGGRGGLLQLGAQSLPECRRDRRGRAAVNALLDFLLERFQRGRFLPLTFFKKTKSGADNFTGGLVAAGVDGLVDKGFEVRG